MRDVSKRKASEPVWWRWTVSQIDAAEREPDRFAKELAEIRTFMDAQSAAIEASPGMVLYRQHADLWPRLPEYEREHSLDEVLSTVDAVKSYGSAHAARAKPAPAWHAAAKREAARLIEQGINPRNVASKLACLPQFSTYTLRTIRNALR